jgi:hypothetical protein
MRAGSTRTRSYLSQLAEPIQQGQPVFVAHKDALAPPDKLPAQVPVIEDVVVNPESQPEWPDFKPARLNPAVRNAQAPNRRDDFADEVAEPATNSDPVVQPGAVQSSSRFALEQPATQTVGYLGRLSAPGASDKQVGQGTADGIDLRPKELSRFIATRPQKSHDVNRQSPLPPASNRDSEAVPPSEADSPLGQDARANKGSIPSPIARAESGAPASRQTLPGQSAPRSATSSVESGRDSDRQPTDAAVGNFKGDASGQRQTVSDPNLNARRKSTGSGPRVLIGTVEIRTRMAQPAIAPTAPPQRIADRNMDRANLQSGARPAGNDSVVRGLGWPYGLIQG